MQRLDFETFNPRLLSIYKACLILSSLIMPCLMCFIHRPTQYFSIRVIFVGILCAFILLKLTLFFVLFLLFLQSLIPSQEEVQRQRKFLTQLDRLVARDWGGAKLFLFGSCANDFGVRNSDIDVCLSVDDEYSSKAELVTKMAGILRSDDMQNVQVHV